MSRFYDLNGNKKGLNMFYWEYFTLSDLKMACEKDKPIHRLKNRIKTRGHIKLWSSFFCLI